MPIYEYRCRDCDNAFEAIVSASRKADCPACHGTNLVKLLSSPGMVGAATARSEGCAMPSRPVCGGGTCGCH
jgi:putative FmdB family regulatory protein